MSTDCPGTRASRGPDPASRPVALSRRSLLHASLVAAGGLLAACTLDRVDRELPPVTLPPVEVVQPPPLPTATPEATPDSPTAATDATDVPQAASATIQFEAWGPRVLLEALSEIERGSTRTRRGSRCKHASKTH